MTTVNSAVLARNAGIALVLNNNATWATNARKAIVALPSGTTGIGEDFRHKVVQAVGEPRHPNAWGGVINGLLRDGILVETGEMRNMQDTRSHARKSAVLRRV